MSILSDDTPNLERATVSDTATFIASGAGVGLSPWAPGTMGSLLGVLMLWPIENFPLALCWVVWMLVAVVAVWSAHTAGESWGVIDHPAIVIDEVVGVWLAILVPASLLAIPMPSVSVMLGCLLLFRVYDILKPWPVNWCERNLQGGLGVVCDDLAAGAMAGLCMTVGYTVLASMGMH